MGSISMESEPESSLLATRNTRSRRSALTCSGPGNDDVCEDVQRCFTLQELGRAMLEDEMPLPTDIRIETGMVKILKAGFGVESNCFVGQS